MEKVGGWDNSEQGGHRSEEALARKEEVPSRLSGPVGDCHAHPAPLSYSCTLTGGWEAPLAPAVHPKNNPLINFLASISSQSLLPRQVLLLRAQGPARSRLNKEWTVRVPALSDDRGQGILVR